MLIAAYGEKLSETQAAPGPTVVLTLTWTADASKAYLLIYSGTLKSSSTTTTGQTYMIDGNLGPPKEGECTYSIWGNVAARQSVSGARLFFAGDLSGAQDFRLRVERTAGTGTISMFDATMFVFELRDVDIAASGSLASASDWTNVVSITFTPAIVQDYLLLALAQTGNVEPSLRVTKNGTPLTNSTMQILQRGTSDAFAFRERLSQLPASSVTYALQANGGPINQAHIVAFPINTNASDDLQAGTATTTSTTPQNRSSVVTPVIAKPHLIVAQSYVSFEGTQFGSARGIGHDFIDSTASETFHLTDYRPAAGSQKRSCCFSMLKRTLTAGSKTYLTRWYRVGTSAQNCVIEHSGITLVPLVRRVAIDGPVINVDV